LTEAGFILAPLMAMSIVAMRATAWKPGAGLARGRAAPSGLEYKKPRMAGSMVGLALAMGEKPWELPTLA
jgi:hypothetical protein